MDSHELHPRHWHSIPVTVKDHLHGCQYHLVRHIDDPFEHGLISDSHSARLFGAFATGLGMAFGVFEGLLNKNSIYIYIVKNILKGGKVKNSKSKKQRIYYLPSKG